MIAFSASITEWNRSNHSNQGNMATTANMANTATTRTTFTLDKALAETARQLKINLSEAAREGVVAAVKRAMGEADRTAYQRFPEKFDDFWDNAEAWQAQ